MPSVVPVELVEFAELDCPTDKYHPLLPTNEYQLFPSEELASEEINSSINNIAIFRNNINLFVFT